ncbi:MAG: Fe-S cluster assembly protein SufD [Bacteroidota bacterium]
MAILKEKEDIIKYFTELYEQHGKALTRQSADVVNERRVEAREFFSRFGLPGKKDEKYKYTYLEPHLKNGYNTLFEPEKITFDSDDLFRCDVPELDTHVIILLNGFYYERFNKQATPKGITVGSFQQMAAQYPDIYKKHYGKIADIHTDGLVSLNTMLAQDGIFIHVPKNSVNDKPIQIINLLLADKELLVQHRNLFVLEPGSKAEVIICDHTLSPHKYMTNSVSEVYVDENAHLDITRVQNEHNGAVQLSNLFIKQEAGSNVKTQTFTLHGGVVRNNAYVQLNGEGAHNDTNGFFITDQRQHVDSFTLVEHNVPNCTSNQLFKGVLDDMSTGAFNGKIYVAQDAQKTSAFQRNNNILLTDTAKMHSKPQLEIYADDVKCSHGATMGQLDEQAMFYLQSRGINKKESRLLLMFAFAHEIIKEIKSEPLRRRIDELIDKRLRGELTRCNNCAMHCG